jgi:hypothetical protein
MSPLRSTTWPVAPLLAQGQTKAAKEHLKKAASSEDVVVKREAEERLRALP